MDIWQRSAASADAAHQRHSQSASMCLAGLRLAEKTGGATSVVLSGGEGFGEYLLQSGNLAARRANPNRRPAFIMGFGEDS